MKIRTLIPAIIALVILVSGPFGFGPLRDSNPRGGLICYCCSAVDQNCPMISCACCCGGQAGFTADRWSPEMILVSFPATTPLQIAYGDIETVGSPETIYIEVPDRPPKTS
jgi:hypothetical protein